MSFQIKIVKTENVLRLWRMTNLTIKEKVLAISKRVHLSLIATLPYGTINQLNITQKLFIRNRRNLKVKRSTFSNSYKQCQLEDVPVFAKVVSLQSL